MVSTKKPNRKIAILVIRPPKGRGARKCPGALDKGVGSERIVRPGQFSVQMQMVKKKPYQMRVQAPGFSLCRVADFSSSAYIPVLMRPPTCNLYARE